MTTWKVTRSKLTYDEIIEYKKTNGAVSAKLLLMLAGPDGFDGDIDDYNYLMDNLDEEASDNVEMYDDGNNSNTVDV